jgi:aminoglycoside phosphotransferase (APT) family kinase protein
VAPISGGFWSAAYTYCVGEEEFVLRLSDMADGFALDVAAMQFTAPDLPIPEVIDVGEALGYHYAISRPHFGRFVEDVSIEEADAVGGALARLLAALRAVQSTRDDAVVWHEPDATAELTWRDFLRNGLIEQPDSLVSGWRDKLAANRQIDAIFRACESRIEELLSYCPERRDLVHGDLLHQNVLISEDARHVTAIFSWKCSVRGDFLFDVAWCTFWGPWHPGIAAADLWNRTLHAPDLSEADLLDAALRHHCYELQIAASHFGWNVWTGNDQDLAAVAAEAKRILDRGPLPMAQLP